MYNELHHFVEMCCARQFAYIERDHRSTFASFENIE